MRMMLAMKLMLEGVLLNRVSAVFAPLTHPRVAATGCTTFLFSPF